MARRRKQGNLVLYLIGGVAVIFLGIIALGLVYASTLIASNLPAIKTKTTTNAFAGQPTQKSPFGQPPEKAKPLVVSSDDLRREFANNEVAADQKYKNKDVEVTGVVAAIVQEPPLVGILFGTLQDDRPAVLCDIQPSDAAKLRPGQTVTVRGVCMGKTQAGPIGIGNARIVR